MAGDVFERVNKLCFDVEVDGAQRSVKNLEQGGV